MDYNAPMIFEHERERTERNADEHYHPVPSESCQAQ